MSTALSLSGSETRVLLDIVYTLRKERIDQIIQEAKRKRKEGFK